MIRCDDSMISDKISFHELGISRSISSQCSEIVDINVWLETNLQVSSLHSFIRFALREKFRNEHEHVI